MSEKPYNELAFPVQDCSSWQYHGMTLRDYFAAKAMQGMITSPQWPLAQDMAEIAKRAYNLADAMLNERVKDQTL